MIMYKYVSVFASPHIKKFIVKMLRGEYKKRALTDWVTERGREANMRRSKPDSDVDDDHEGETGRVYFCIF